jgi:Ca-activated chloride channel family protein
VATVLKPDAVADLETNVQNRQPDPLLAQWQYGLGRVAVWTPGLEGAWPASWRQTQPEFWSDVLDWTLRGPTVAAYAASVVPGPAGDIIQIDTLNNSGVARELQQLDLEVRAPGGKTSHLLATQTGPGLYQVPLQVTAPGIYVVTARPVFGSDQLAVTSAVAVPYSAEYLPAPADESLLGTLAASTGGASLPATGSTATVQPRSGQSTDMAWPLLLGALILFFAAVGTGRWLAGAEPAPEWGP